MLKAEIRNKMVLVNTPQGNVSFNSEFLKGLKKEEFNKMYKGKIDTKEVWKAIRPHTKG